MYRITAFANDLFLKNGYFSLFLTANNLYGWAQSQRLPIGDYHWLTQEEINNLDIMNLKEDDDHGYVFEVDLEYPAHLHAHHSSFPLAPHSMKITNSVLSPYAQGEIFFVFLFSKI